MTLTPTTRDIERLAGEVSELTGETKAEAIRVALVERLARLRDNPLARRSRLLSLLEMTFWSSMPTAQRGHRLTGAEEAAILGYSQEGC